MIIKNVAELYQALADANNEGGTLELTAGVYQLNELTGTDKAGRIEFLKDLTIRGVVNDRGKVVIDASTLPGTSFNPSGGFPARTGAIRMGNGHNKLEWVTVIGSATDQALSVIDTDLIVPTVPSHVEISHCVITSGRIGIDIRNVGVPSNKRIVHAKIEYNEITRVNVSAPGTQQGQGIIVQHANGVSEAQLHVTMKENNIHANTIGLRVFNNTTNLLSDTVDNKIWVHSQDDNIDNNKLGINIAGSLNSTVATKCERNEIVFDAHKSIFQNNRGIIKDAGVLPCGIFISGGTRPRTGSPTSGNKVTLKFKNCTFSGNQDFDIRAFGALTLTTLPPAESTDPQPSPGENNLVLIKLTGESKNATIWTMDSFPVDPATANEVDVKATITV